MIKTGQAGDVDDLLIVTTAGEALSARDAVYISASDSKAYKCDQDDTSKLGFAGFAQEAAALNAAVNVIPPGLMVTGFSGLTTEATYYLSATAGAITATPPTNAVRVGIARSATVLEVLRPDFRKIVFSADGTWTKRTGLRFIEVELWGAGGSGARDASAASGGGGGGGYARARFEASELSGTEAVVVGTGGTSIAADDTNGNPGEDTSFGSLLLAYGGGGGTFGSPCRGGGGGGEFAAGASSGAGGASGGATSPTSPFTAVTPSNQWGGGHGGSADGSTAGAAGAAFFGGGGGGSRRSAGTNGAGGASKRGGAGGSGGGTGVAGTIPGGGGGASSTGASGAGADGRAIVYEYY